MGIIVITNNYSVFIRNVNTIYLKFDSRDYSFEEILKPRC
jgi:hypothetical protein